MSAADRISLSTRSRFLLPAATDYVLGLAFGRPVPDPASIDDDWLAAFREASGIHGLGPYLGLRVTAGEIAPPAPISTWLVEQVERNRARLRRMRAELDVTLDSLRRSGIEAIPLKGAAMLACDVDGLVWRSIGDLDLLVRDVHERELDLAVAHAGYCLAAASWKHRRYAPCASGAPLVLNDGEHPDNPRDLEVHADVVEMFRGFRWDLTPWLAGALAEGGGYQVPNDQAMTLHLAVHASISILEGTARAIQLIDLVRAVGRSGTDTLLQVVNATGADTHARFVYPAVALAARETSDPSCACLAGQLAPHVAPAMRDWIAAVSLYHVSWAGRHDRVALDRHAIWARSRADRARMLRHTLLPSPAVLASETTSFTGVAGAVRAYRRHYARLARRATARTAD
jgi:hypothetical protein